MSDTDLSNRPVALVTGASYGLGAEIAITLARDGFDVAVTELNANDLDQTVAEIEMEEGAKAAAFDLDLRDIENLKENQVSFEDTMMLNMGQVLSIPCVIIGIFLAFGGLEKLGLNHKVLKENLL